MRIEIRELQEKDIEALAEIEAQIFSMPWSAKAFKELLNNPCCVYLVALADGEVVGGAGYTSLCGEANIDNVAVAERHRNQGVGGLLLGRLMQRAQEDQIGAFTLEVRVSNAPAIHLYEKFGFHSEGIRPGFYEKPREDAMIMWRR